MSEIHDYYTNARNLAVDILRKEASRTKEQVNEVALKAIQAVRMFAPDAEIDAEALTAELLHLFSVSVADATVLEDHDVNSHVPWLPTQRAQIPWRFWNRYMTYLERDFGMPPAVVTSLHDLTNVILERMEDPRREGPWDRRGMVVGSVQSGKTANYIGLINKAVDAGYKLVIVLAGIHRNLRAQTQVRIDQGVLGFDTQKSRRLNTDSHWVGVGMLPGESLVIHSLTSSADDGDFNRRVADTIGVMLGGDPVVLVIKKNTHLLANLIRWVLHVAGSEEAGRRLIKNVPLLLIDDEADNASINTRDKAGQNSETATAINGKIRKLLDSFDKSAYVGYTATPFANIFINPDAELPDYGSDLFPRSFIVNVKAPTNYVGPSRVFGFDGDVDAGITGQEGLPIVREVYDYATPATFPPRHKKDHVPQELPDSLKTAIHAYILTCAARRARGQKKRHNSMLVHVTRFVAVQGHVVCLIRDYLLSLQRRIEFGDGKRRNSVRDELRALWEAEFMPTSELMRGDGGLLLAWSSVDAELHAAAAKIRVMPINGYAKDALDYIEHEEEGLSVIAVGGDKLSRGLTLEGLSISYFLRTSRMYDTLMQMGRWFGYRPGYLDLCRLYTTPHLVEWYRHIALVDAELRREFDYMVNAGLTPEQYGLRVRTHPGGMIVTAINKMCHARSLRLSWSGVLVQTSQLPKDELRISKNKQVTVDLLRKFGVPCRDDELQPKIWRDCKAEDVAEFLEDLQFPPESARASGKQLADFLRKQASKPQPELVSWTVVLVSNTQAKPEQTTTFAGFKIGLNVRNPESQKEDSFALKKANILSPLDESLDLAEMSISSDSFSILSEKPEIFPEVQQADIEGCRTFKDLAVKLTQRRIAAGTLRGNADKKVPNGRVVRELRPKNNGLLLIYPLMAPATVPAGNGRSEEMTGLSRSLSPIIGIAMSFPTSHTVVGIEYRVNKVWEALLQEDSAYED